jgi:hypothetical protein
MSESVGTKVGSRSSNAFLRVVAALAVALACAEFLVAIHYHDRWVAAQSLRNVADEFQTFYVWLFHMEQNEVAWHKIRTGTD